MYNPEIIQYINIAFIASMGVMLLLMLWFVGSGLVSMHKYGTWGRHATDVRVCLLLMVLLVLMFGLVHAIMDSSDDNYLNNHQINRYD